LRDINHSLARTIAESKICIQFFADFGVAASPEIMAWLETLVSSRQIIDDMSEGSGRISNPVVSIKGHLNIGKTSDFRRTNMLRHFVCRRVRCDGELRFVLKYLQEV
jgi:hypothetical protein